MKRNIYLALASITILAAACGEQPAVQGPYLANGIKVGEATDHSIIVWARTTFDSVRVGADAPMPEALYRNPEAGEWEPRSGRRPDMEVKVVYPEGHNVNNIEGAVPGATGEVRVRYRPQGGAEWMATAWQETDKDHDFIQQMLLEDLEAGTAYVLVVQCRPVGVDVVSDEMSGGFVTAPAPDREANVRFTVSTGQAYGDQDAEGGGYKIYPTMLELDPHFFVHTGDIVYYDGLAKNVDLAYWHWQRMYSLPTNVAFHKQVGSYFIKDDHDTWMNDCWPGRETRFMGDFTFEQGLEIFLHVVPMGEKTYRTRRWGEDLQVWMVEGRDFRSPNTMPDGPDKTIWGEEQKQWFKETVEASDASFKILISPTPVVGPDRKNKKDNHSNASFSHEGNEIREFISQQPNMYVVCGDRHWQYVSKDAETGVLEFSCGPASDEHAGGWSQDDVRPEHLYLNVIGGFLEVEVDREDGKPVIAFRHYGVDGDLLHEHEETAEPKQ